MSYTKLTDFASKDALLTGNPSKLVRGTELGAEFDAIETADALNIKPDTVTTAAAKTTPVDADLFTLFDSASTFSLKKLTWANIKATLKTYFDTLYAESGANTSITSLGAVTGVTATVGDNTTKLATTAYVKAASTTGNAATATTATHASGGVAGAVHWQSGAGASGFTAAGTSGQVLTSGGATTPTWTSQSALAAGTATTATHVAGGVAGAVHYQSGVGATGFSAAGASGQVLTSTGSGAPVWVAQSSIAAGSAATVSGTVSISNGGTGSTTAAGARAAIGAAASGANTDITSLGAVTGVTATTGDDTTKLATTAYVKAASTTGNAATATTASACSGNSATATSATSATNATNVAVTDDTTTNATYYPALATTNSGNVAPRVSSTKLTFNPSTGQLAAVTFAGAGTGLTGTAASFTAGNATNAATAANATNLGGVAASGYARSGANTDITSLGNNTSTVYTTAGTSTAYTITPTPVIAAYAIGQSFFVNFNAACGAAPTITISGVATPPNLVKENSDGTFSNLAAGDIPINHRSRVTLISTTQALVEKMPQALTLGTSVATTSGTAIDFTSIPTWVKRITLMLNGVSTSGTGDLILRMGAGSVLSSGYVGNVGLIRNGGTSNNYAFSTSFIIASEVGAADTYSGSVVLTLLGSNIWTINGCVSGGSIRTNCCCGVVPVGGTNDRIRFTTSTGDTFDAGSVNITYE